MKVGLRLWLVLFSFICFYFMLIIKYDPDFKITSILPLTYAFVLSFIVRDSDIKSGLGAKALVFFYIFRMCVLPIVCAVGNFYLEPDKNDYIKYYAPGVFLIVIECIIVFSSLRYYSHYFMKKKKLCSNINININNDENQLFKYVIWALTIIIIILNLGLSINYYTPITKQAEEIVKSELIDFELIQGPWWYVTDLLSSWWRPLITIYLISEIEKRNIPHPYFWIILISLINIYYMSERRIYALLVGGFALYYAMSISRSIFLKRIISVFLIVSGCMTIYLGFYHHATSDIEMLSRTFQRYFSGPTLNALGLRTLDVYGIRPFEFVSLLLDDFQSFTWLFGRIEIPEYYMPLFGVSQGLWTPMTVGALQYFGPFFPMVLIFFVYFIKRSDYDAQTCNSPLYSMLYYYSGVVVSCYMVMYTTELIFYFIIATALLFRSLVYLDRRIRLSRWKIIFLKNRKRH